MKKGILLALPLMLMAPLLLLVLGMGNANVEAVRAACTSDSVPPPDASGGMRIGTFNTKPHWGRDARRAAQGMRKFDAAGVTLVALQELGGGAVRGIRSVDSWKVLRATPNSPAPHGGLGNGIAYRSDIWTMSQASELAVPNTTRTVKGTSTGPARLHLPFARFTSTRGHQLTLMSIHHVAGQAPQQQRFRRIQQRRTRVKATSLASQGTAVVVAGDFNDPRPEGMQPLRLADSGGIDLFFGTGVQFSRRVIDRTFQHSGITDHPAAHVKVRLGESAVPTGDPTGATGNCEPCPREAGVPSALPNLDGIRPQVEAAEVAAEAAYRAGFRGSALVTAVAIARVESTWNPRATNGSHFGLWQISARHRGKVPGWNQQADIFDPLLNAKYAFALYSARPGSGEAKFADWIPFEKTDYRQYLETARQAVAAVGGGTTNGSSTGCSTGVESGGVSGDRLHRLRQRAEMVIKLARQYSSPCSVPGFDCQGVGFSGWSNACTAISMMIYGNAYVGSGDGSERAYGSVVQGKQGSSWPPPPGAIVSWPYSGSGHVAIYLGDGDWVDNWGPVGHNAHDQVEKGATAHWLLPPPSFEGTFLNNGIGTSST